MLARGISAVLARFQRGVSQRGVSAVPQSVAHNKLHTVYLIHNTRLILIILHYRRIMH